MTPYYEDDRATLYRAERRIRLAAGMPLAGEAAADDLFGGAA